MAESKGFQKHDEQKDLSELPDDVIKHIMSFLTRKDVSAMALVSKRWYALQASFPCPILDLNELRFRQSLGFACIYDPMLHYSTSEDRLKANDKFLDFAHESLVEYLRKKPYMGTVKLESLHELDTSRLNSLIKYAVKNNIGELHLMYRHPSSSLPYKLPPTLISSKSLTILRLRWCFIDDSDLAGNPMLDSLQELYLEEVNLSPRILSLFLGRCPSLRALTLRYCRHYYIYIFNLSHVKLKKIRVIHDFCIADKINIEARNLQTLSYSNYKETKAELDLHDCKNLELLQLNCEVFPSGISENICGGFPNLRTLRLWRCRTMKRLKISSESLENLSLLEIGSLLDAEFNALNVHSFECDTQTISCATSIASPWRQYMFRSFTHFVSLTRHGIMTKINKRNSIILDTIWFLTLTTLLGKLSQNVDVSLHIDPCDQVKFRVDEVLQGVFDSPCCNVKHMKLRVFTLRSHFFQEKKQVMYIPLIDGLFWSCHPLKVSTSGNKVFKEVLYQELMNRERKKNCCGSTHIRCWRHSLKGFEIEQFEKVNDENFISFKLKW